MQMMLAAKVERGDVVFCSSLSGNNAEVIKAARLAADYGATTVALTMRDTPLVKAVALALTIDITNDGDVLGPACLRDAFLVAVDMLAYGAPIRNRAHARKS
jgi:DNA-binding MurR/RpiR family transcriptional regulator